MDKTVTSKYGLESAQKQKSLIFSDFILNSYGWLRLFTGNHFPKNGLQYSIE